jgi:thioesterase domain-containing protein
MELIDLYEQAAPCSLEISADRIGALDPLGQLNLLARRLAQLGLVPPRLQAADLTGTVRTFETALRTRYRPERAYPAPLRLVLAPDPKKDRQANEQSIEKTAAEWRFWAPDLKVWRSPGNHLTMLRHPHVAALSNWLWSELRRSSSRSRIE